MLLFSPSVVRIGVPLSVALKLQDAPSGQVVRGSVFLRNPSHVNELCSPKVDFSLSSDRDFILLNIPVKAYSLLVPPSAPPPVLLCLLGNIFVFSSPCSLPPLPALCSSVFQSVFPLLLCLSPTPSPSLPDPPGTGQGLFPPSPPQSPRGAADGAVLMAKGLSVQTDRHAGCQPVVLLSPGAPLSADGPARL